MASVRRPRLVLSSTRFHAFHFEHAFICGDEDNDEKIIHTDLQGALSELEHLGAVGLANRMAIISLVGQDMKNTIGVSAEMLRALGENGINVQMISQGRSPTRCETFCTSIPFPAFQPCSYAR